MLKVNLRQINDLCLMLFFGLILFSSSLFAHDDEPFFSDAELDQMVAPIALYPDTVLSNVLIASTYPLEVVRAALWLSRHETLTADEALDVAEGEDWDDSVKALVAFPDLLEQMSDDLDWTRNLGDAFLEDENRLLDRVQVLRHLAAEEGTFDDDEHFHVIRDGSNIIIEPVERDVIYVPYYDTRTVYGSWHWHDYPPVRWTWHGRYTHFHDYYHNHAGLYAGNIFWYPSIRLSSNVRVTFQIGAFHWGQRHLVVLDRHYYRRPIRHSGRQSIRTTYRHHRRHILSHKHARRWRHQVRHRRGVRYRTEQVRVKYRHEGVRPARHRPHRQRHHQDNRILTRTTVSSGQSVSRHSPNKQTSANVSHRQTIVRESTQRKVRRLTKPARARARSETQHSERQHVGAASRVKRNQIKRTHDRQKHSVQKHQRQKHQSPEIVRQHRRSDRTPPKKRIRAKGSDQHKSQHRAQGRRATPPRH